MSSTNMFTVTPSQVYAKVLHCLKVGLTPIVLSSPGMGKSSIFRKIAKDHRLKLIDCRVGHMLPEDFNGYPMRIGDKACFTPFDMFPLEGEAIPEGYDGWLLLLDEVTSATKPVQAALYKVVLDRMIGSFKLHPNVAIAAAGNKVSDNAVAYKMSTALQSRLIHYEMEVSHPEFIEHAMQEKYDHRVISFLNYLPSRLMDFRPDHQDSTFPCPRTYEFLSKLVKGRDIDDSMGPDIAGTIGPGVATEFITFAQEFGRLPKYADIAKDPDRTVVPPESSTKYATMSMLVENTKIADLDSIIKYVKRFEIEMQILFCRGFSVRVPDARQNHKEFIEYLRGMVRYLQ